MTHTYTLAEAQELLPEAEQHLTDAAQILTELRRAAQQQGGWAEGREAAVEPADRTVELEGLLEEHLRWFDERGIQVKGLTPGLLDFPAHAIRDGERIDILLCWRDDEDAIAYYHPPETGYVGREPVAMLDEV